MERPVASKKNSNNNNNNNHEDDDHDDNAPVGGHGSQLAGSGCESSQRQGEGKPPELKSLIENNAESSSSELAGAQDAAQLDEFKRQIVELRSAGQRLRSDADQPALLQKPDWFQEDLFENAKSLYARHFMAINFAHLSGLLLLVRVNSIYRTLSVTGKSDSVAKLFRRYYQTVCHVKRWYEGDIFEADSEAHRSLLLVRGMHNQVSRNLNDQPVVTVTPAATASVEPEAQGAGGAEDGREEQGKLMLDAAPLEGEGVHISEYDILLTQFAFVGFIVTRAKHVGLLDDFNEHDLASLLHFWRLIGHFLGASDQFNLCARTPAQVAGLCEAILELEFKRSIRDNPLASPPGVMGVNIVRSVKFIPMMTIYGITKYLYELLHMDTAEFEARATHYSRLSYTFIKLVMSNLLAYRALRWFNNGLTRLSVFLVGKWETAFANHLDSKYGQELRL